MPYSIFIPPLDEKATLYNFFWTSLDVSVKPSLKVICRSDCQYQCRHLLDSIRSRQDFTVVDAKDGGDSRIVIDEYENIAWEHVMSPPFLVTNNFCIRKGIGRKSNLAEALSRHVKRCSTQVNSHHECPLLKGVPETIIIDTTPVFINRSKWLDVKSALAECVFEAEDAIEEAKKISGKNDLWILKPSITNKGAEIYIVDNSEELTKILRSLPEIGLWVLQKYVPNPLLLCPYPINSGVVTKHKFHLRMYVAAVGALSAFIFPEALVLFAARPFDLETKEKSAHVTNTCVGVSDEKFFEEETHVRSFAELPELLKQADSHFNYPLKRYEDITKKIYNDICLSIGHSFAAMEQNGVGGYMPLPRCWELYGVDFLVTDTYTPILLEFNPCPDVKQTGTRLDPIISRMTHGLLSIGLYQRVTVTGNNTFEMNVQPLTPSGVNILESGVLPTPYHDAKSGWELVYSKFWRQAHEKMNINVTSS